MKQIVYIVPKGEQGFYFFKNLKQTFKVADFLLIAHVCLSISTGLQRDFIIPASHTDGGAYYKAHQFIQTFASHP